jgi:hypothetical protein
MLPGEVRISKALFNRYAVETGVANDLSTIINPLRG